MTAKTPGLKSVGGRYRVQGNTLYQKESPDDKEFKKVIGKKVAGRDGKVRVEFTDFRTSTEPGAPPIHVQGTALLTFDKFGNWSGRFIDSTGRHWEFQCERVQE